MTSLVSSAENLNEIWQSLPLPNHTFLHSNHIFSHTLQKLHSVNHNHNISLHYPHISQRVVLLHPPHMYCFASVYHCVCWSWSQVAHPSHCYEVPALYASHGSEKGLRASGGILPHLPPDIMGQKCVWQANICKKRLISLLSSAFCHGTNFTLFRESLVSIF